MEGISDIRIMGVDEKRWPRIRKEPYITLFFALSHKAPPAWCADFNRLLSKHKYSPKIREEEGLYIESWVRTPDEIPGHLVELQEAVKRCTEEFIEKVKAAAVVTTGKAEEGGEQVRLNEILARLRFE